MHKSNLLIQLVKTIKQAKLIQLVKMVEEADLL